MAVDDDFTEDVRLCVEGDEPAVDDETVAFQEDSETEMLRRFVTRVKADKTAKATTANVTLTRRKLRPQRRSGSMGSATSSTGSPIG